MSMPDKLRTARQVMRAFQLNHGQMLEPRQMLTINQQWQRAIEICPLGTEALVLARSLTEQYAKLPA